MQLSDSQALNKAIYGFLEGHAFKSEALMQAKTDILGPWRLEDTHFWKSQKPRY